MTNYSSRDVIRRAQSTVMLDCIDLFKALDEAHQAYELALARNDVNGSLEAIERLSLVRDRWADLVARVR